MTEPWRIVLAFLLLASTPAREDVPDVYRQSYLLEGKGDYAGALARMEEIRKRSGASYFVSLRTGWLNYLAGKHEAAEARYRDAIAAKPNAIEAKIGLTLVLYVAQRWKPLEAACKQVLKEDPQHATVRARLAASYYNSGNYPDAATIYRKLVESFPGELDFQTGYAWALLRMGKRDEASKYFQAVLAVSPDNPNAIQGMSTQ
jgi:tetratricopeptide (TPR) repeat protein